MIPFMGSPYVYFIASQPKCRFIKVSLCVHILFWILCQMGVGEQTGWMNSICHVKYIKFIKLLLK